MHPMNLVSVLGLVALLGIAWALSYHRRRVPLRTVAWGLGLQLLFAVIILREGVWSFVGMAVLGSLLVVYMLRGEGAAPGEQRPADGDPAEGGDAGPVPRPGGGGWGPTAAAAAGATALAFACGRFLPAVLPWLLGALVLFLLLNARFRFARPAQRWAGVLFVALGVAFLISRGLTGQVIFGALSDRVAAFLNLSNYGARFLFGNLVPRPGGALAGEEVLQVGFIFAFQVLPTIIFFGGLMAVLYFLGIMQKVIEALARFMRWTIGTSGAETLSCSANIFVGQTEAPLLIKPFLARMTPSELLTIMVGGFATIAGGVLAGYIAMGVPAGDLIAASVMSAPAALVLGKILYPETEHSETAGDVKLPDIETGGNVIEAAANGITDGLKLAVNVGAMLVGFIALIAVVDMLLNFLDGQIDGRLLGGTFVEYGTGGLSPAVGEYRGWFPGSLQTLFGTILRPLAFLLGVPWEDAAQVGNLLGIKLSLNEFVAYGQLGTYIAADSLSPRAVTISTYALCGFANFSSIGIQIGGIAAIAPERKAELARVGLKAMIGGALASWSTATIAGILIG